MRKHKILLIGLGSIGENLALSLIEKGYQINIWDKNKKKTFLLCKKLNIKYISNISKFLKKKNLIIILAIPAGLATDNFIINNIKNFKTNIHIVDIGNNHPKDTMKRFNFLKKDKIKYISCGFSGGSQGARTNASLMISCSSVEFNFLKSLFLDIIGKKNKRFLKRIGNNPSLGNYTKIIHNGIEYAVMQAIADYYCVMKVILRLDNKEILKEFSKLEKKISNSFLIRITKDIIKESNNKKNSINNILDVVDDNNTGAWTVSFASECKFAIPSISSSVEARFISRKKRIFKNFKIKNKKFQVKNIKNKMLEILYLTIIASYLQGIGLLQEITNKKKITINLKYIFLCWMNNSIIRSSLLNEYYLQIKNNKIDINNIFKKKFSLNKNKSLIEMLIFLINRNIALTSITSLFNWTNLLIKRKNISFSLIQKQRNFFGGHKISFHKK
jgi:6-phosphogluconate dehydrogenase|tara:strand:- start:699 stop:2030 length:1332 start_codon:yes stop_codon:yes gene_type:complete